MQLFNPMAYVIDSPIANAVLKSCTTATTSNNNPEANMENGVMSLAQLRHELEQTKAKLASKNYECNRLRQQLKQCSTEIEQYKQILSSINNENVNLASFGANQQTTGAGNTTNNNKSPKDHKKANIKGGAKNRSNSCQCCCDADKPYICDWVNCGKRFRQKPHLEAHRNIHTGRRFLCDWPNCGKSFVRKYNLAEHQKLHSAVNPNLCTYPDCGKVFSSKYSLMRHQNAQHNLNLT